MNAKLPVAPRTFMEYMVLATIINATTDNRKRRTELFRFLWSNLCKEFPWKGTGYLRIYRERPLRLTGDYKPTLSGCSNKNANIPSKANIVAILAFAMAITSKY